MPKERKRVLRKHIKLAIKQAREGWGEIWARKGQCTKMQSGDTLPLINELKGNTTVTKFRLSANGIRSSEDIMAIVELITINRTITSLNLSGNCLHQHFDLLFYAINNNPVLTSLDISQGCRYFSPENMFHFNAFIRENKTIKQLNASGCFKITDDFANALTFNHTLTKLIITQADFDESAITLIADNLKFNKSLTHLDLSSYHTLPVQPFIDALLVNTTLNHLRLQYYDYQNRGTKVFQLAKANNIVSDVFGPRLPEEVFKIILRYLKEAILKE